MANFEIGDYDLTNEDEGVIDLTFENDAITSASYLPDDDSSFPIFDDSLGGDALLDEGKGFDELKNVRDTLESKFNLDIVDVKEGEKKTLVVRPRQIRGPKWTVPPNAAIGLHNYISPELERTDPIPDIRELFVEFNERFFHSRLSSAEVVWSKRMTLCAGICSYHPNTGHCSIRLSEPILKMRSRADLVDTLLHEMIHAWQSLCGQHDHDSHGPEFLRIAENINKIARTKITVFHTFHDEVDAQRGHWWRCDGPCRTRRPFFGYVRRAMNRAPSSRDPWWSQHQSNCGGSFTKIREPEGYQKKGSSSKSINIAGGVSKRMQREDGHILGTRSTDSDTASTGALSALGLPIPRNPALSGPKLDPKSGPNSSPTSIIESPPENKVPGGKFFVSADGSVLKVNSKAPVASASGKRIVSISDIRGTDEDVSEEETTGGGNKKPLMDSQMEHHWNNLIESASKVPGRSNSEETVIPGKNGRGTSRRKGETSGSVGRKESTIDDMFKRSRSENPDESTGFFDHLRRKTEGFSEHAFFESNFYNSGMIHNLTDINNPDAFGDIINYGNTTISVDSSGNIVEKDFLAIHNTEIGPSVDSNSTRSVEIIELSDDD